jgi:hypothetical protein
VRSLLLFIFAILLIFSCKKEKDPLLIFVSPSQISYNLKPEDILRLEITGSSGNELKRLKINQREVNSLSTCILDSALYGNELSFTFEYKVPAGTDTTQYILEMYLYDDTGEKVSLGISVNVFPEDILLTETAGNEMYSHASTGFDAYNLATGHPLHSEISDSSDMNIMDVTNDTINSNTLIRKWESPAGNKFVRFTDFDYAHTSFNSLRNSYNAGIKNSFIENISNGDIILTKLGNPFLDTGYVAIKVVLIIDEDSTQYDRYIFNFKK